MEKLIIDRSTWYRGKGSNDSRLRRVDGLKCCLGFYGELRGVDALHLDNRLMPVSPLVDVSRGSNRWPDWLFSRDLVEARATLANINDNTLHAEAVRERLITAEFAKHGVEVVFVDSLPAEVSP